MSKDKLILITVGLVALVIGVVIGVVIGPLKPTIVTAPAKYVLMFGDSATNSMVTANLEDLHTALANPAPNWSTLEEVPSEGATPTPVPIPTPVSAAPGTLLVTRIQVTQDRRDNGPCTMHVTQKVGLNNSTQVKKVLASLQPETTPWPPPPKP